MKKLTAILVVAILIMTVLTGCGQERQLFNKVKLENYVEVKDYIGIEVDTSSNDFKVYYDSIFAEDVEAKALYAELKEGVVENGDIVNLDYEGKLNGVAFEGGTAKGADLKIGSKTFIDDFEEELIGVAVGETKDVSAVFPNPYQNNPDLAGKEAIFTCKINSIKRAMSEDEAYSKMEFKSADEYKADIKKRAAKQFILDKVTKSAKIKDYPEKDSEAICDAIYEFYIDVYKQEYNVDLEQILASNGTTVEAYKAQIAKELVPDKMNVDMVLYYILDTEKLEILESTLSSQETKQPLIAESYAVQDTVLDYLYGKAKIK